MTFLVESISDIVFPSNKSKVYNNEQVPNGSMNDLVEEVVMEVCSCSYS